MSLPLYILRSLDLIPRDASPNTSCIDDMHTISYVEVDPYMYTMAENTYTHRSPSSDIVPHNESISALILIHSYH